jgi:hypothetical protein
MAQTPGAGENQLTRSSGTRSGTRWRSPDIERATGLAVAALWLLCTAACAPSDPAPPWDAGAIVRDLASDLTLLEEAPFEFSEVVMLAWRVDTGPDPSLLPPIPLPGGSGVVRPPKPRIERALLWGRRGPAGAPIAWALIQAFRGPEQDTPWVLDVMTREISAPLTRLRPGEAADGTWRGYQHYDRPPTSNDACDFAAVTFLAEWGFRHRAAGAIRTRVWTQVLGEAPACGFRGGVNAG